MKFLALFAFVLLGLAMAFGQTVSPTTSPAAVVIVSSPVAVVNATITPVAVVVSNVTTVNTTVSLPVVSKAPVYYKVIYTTSSASALSPFSFFSF